MIASLPWYDYPAWGTELDGLWQALRVELQPGFPAPLPERLERGLSLLRQWSNPDLLLSQCCGPDLVRQAANLMPVARPVFSGLDCPPGYYFSHIVATDVVPANPVLGVNSESSFSGCLALLDWCRREGLEYSAAQITGSHEVTLNELRRGRVHLAAIDANSWRLLDSEDVKIIGRSIEQPSPPFVCGRNSWHRVELLKSALEKILQSLPAVGMCGVVRAAVEDYQPMSSLYHLRDQFNVAVATSPTD